MIEDEDGIIERDEQVINWTTHQIKEADSVHPFHIHIQKFKNPSSDFIHISHTVPNHPHFPVHSLSFSFA
jgi:hypothetical protein